MTKRLFTLFLAILILSTAIFAKSTKINTENDLSDNVEIEDDEVYEAEETDEYTDDSEPVLLTKPKKKGDGLKDLFTFGNKNKYITLDDSSSYTKTLTGGLKQYAATGIINPDTAEAGFGCKNNGLYYLIFMDKSSRDALRKAVDRYLNDFSAKKLDRNNKKSWRSYNKTNITLRWGTIKTSTPNNGIGSAYMGYTFEGKSPYFTITIPEMENIKAKDSDAVVKSSYKITYYFTKAQITSILSMLEEEKIINTINDYIINEYGINQEADEY